MAMNFLINYTFDFKLLTDSLLRHLSAFYTKYFKEHVNKDINTTIINCKCIKLQ